MSKKQPKLTPWFPPKVKPAHVGVYEIVIVTSPRDLNQASRDGFAHWNGKRWGWNSGTPANADSGRNALGAIQHKKWRGLAVKP